MAKSEPLFRRLQRLFRSGPVVRRKVRQVDTSVVVRDRNNSSLLAHIQKSVSPVYNQITSNAYNLAERQMRYQDFVEMEQTPELASALDIYADETCLAGDTVIPLLDGTKSSIEDLYKENRTNFYVYSFDLATSKFVPGKCLGVTKTGSNKQVFKISFDDGTFIRLTDNHLVLLSSGEYKRVRDLKSGESIRSLYTSISSKKKEDRLEGYEKILDADGKWKYTHRVVAEYTSPDTKGVVHHVDFNKRNNLPENLVFMNYGAHQALHASLNSYRWKNNPEYAQKMSAIFSENAKKLHSQPGWTAHFIERKNQVFASYSKEEKRKIFGRPLEQNGMFGNGVVLQKEKNGRWRKDYVRQISKNEILKWIQQGKTTKEVCEMLPMNPVDLHAHLVSYGIKKWGKCFIVDTEKAIANLKEWIKLQPAEINLHRKFSKACKFAGITRNDAYTALLQSGYSNWGDFLNRTNHLISEIVPDGNCDVYDLEVEGFHNFAAGGSAESDSYVVVHNCAQDDKGRSLHVYSDDGKIKNILEELFYDTLNIEFNLRPWIRNLCKYGDFLAYIDVHTGYGIQNLIPIPVNEAERVEGFDPSEPMAVKYRWLGLGNRELQNWEVLHMRLLGNDTFLPYGSSVIEPARRIWRQLILIEDAMLTYRITRAPERRVFYVDVGNLEPEAIPNYIEQQRQALRMNPVIDRNTGRVDMRYASLSLDEDYILPVRGTESGTKIDTLAGGQNVAAVEDVQYIQKKLFAALRIPRAYLGYEEGLASKSSLSQEDIRFSRTIQSIQRVVISELNKLAIIHLAAHGFDGDELLNFNLRMSNPSTVAQQQKLELYRAKFEIAGTAPEGLVDRKFIRKNILGLNDEEIEEIESGKESDRSRDLELEQMFGEGGGELGGGGGGGSAGSLAAPAASGGEAGGEDIFGAGEASGGGEETSPAPEETAPESPENASKNPEEDEDDDLELLTSSDDPSDDGPKKISFSPFSEKMPIKAKSQLDKYKYDRSRQRTHGARTTGFSDTIRALDPTSPENRDPNDSGHLRSMYTNPFGESMENVLEQERLAESFVKPRLTKDVQLMIGQMRSRLQIPENTAVSSLLNEDIELDNLLIEDNQLIKDEDGNE